MAPNRPRLSGKHGMHSSNSLTTQINHQRVARVVRSQISVFCRLEVINLLDKVPIYFLSILIKTNFSDSSVTLTNYVWTLQ